MAISKEESDALIHAELHGPFEEIYMESRSAVRGHGCQYVPEYTEDMHEILFVFGQWCVTTFGIECSTQNYTISKERLWAINWFRHMGSKPWVNYQSFSMALLTARDVFNDYHDQSDKPITRRRRYQIMQRDKFRCQLCGRKAVDGLTLEVDHKHPKSAGGTNEDTNLWTLCFDCNRGKSNLPLGDEE